jgi:translocation and assembly module TamB
MRILRWIVSLSRIVHWVLTSIAISLVVLAITGLIVIRTQRFRDYVRRRIVEQVETTTNGRFEYGRFVFNWERLTAEMTSVVLHGKETEGPPLVAVDSVTLGFRVISLFERKVDLARVRLERPRVHIVFYDDGSTNIPEPNRKTTWAEDVLNLAVRDYEAVDGVVEYDETRIPFRVHGEGLRVRMSYEPARTLYRGDIATDRVQLAPLGYGPIPVALSAAFTLEKTRLAFSRIRVSTRESRIDLAGALDDIRAPHGVFSVRAALSGAEAVRVFKLPAVSAGTSTLDGKLSIAFAPKFDFGLTGKLAVKGAGFSRGRLKIANADVQGDLNLALDRLSLHNFEAHALGARVTGQMDLSDWHALHFDGAIENLGVQDAAAVITPRAIPWAGEMAGPVHVDGTLGPGSHLAARGELSISPSAGRVPIQGAVKAAWDSGTNTVSLEPSWIATAATRIDVSGTPAQSLAVKLHSSDLDDLLPALALASENAPTTLPIKLNNGTADLEGALTEPLENAAFSGRVSVTNASVEGHALSNFSADLRASKDQVQATRMTLARGNTSVSGSATLGARNGSFNDASLAAQLDIRNAVLNDLLREAAGSAKVPGDIAGTASSTVRVMGTLRAPDAVGTADVQRPAAFGEQADRLRVTFRYLPARIELSAGAITAQNTSISFSGSYGRSGADWNNGRAELSIATTSLPTSRIRSIAQLQPPVEATLAVKLQIAANVANGVPTLTALDGTISAQGVAVYRQMVGEMSASLQTRNADLAVQLNGKVREASFEGSGSWRLAGDEPGSATLRFSRLSVATLNNLAMLGGTPEQQQSSPPFDGFIEGSAALSMPLRKPDQLSADVTLSTVQLTPKPGQSKTAIAAPRGAGAAAGAEAQDIVVRNSGPVTLHVAADGIRIAPAQFQARDTSLAVSGLVPFGTNGADVALRGTINLAILQLLNRDLLARGNASVDATVRGAWRNPAVNGRMQLNNASLYLADLPNGVDNVNGAIAFDRNRATIERLTAETGGGRVSFGGALEFSNTLVYRLQADAQQVRVRWPEDVSTSLSAHLELNGTPDASTLSGTVTLNRTALNARADLGRLMAQAARPAPTPATPNEYLRGMQFDVRVESSPDYELDTALTREVQTGVDLRLRGTPLLPVVLGSVSVNTGEVELFGNRYSIDRGDIRFLNPVRIDPILDMSLETKARGIVVNVSLSGTLQKLRVNYSSDPPLQPSEIIALLAVGRDPSQTAGITNPSAANNTGFAEAGGSLLGEAVSQQLSSRLQRFFGASRVKIDPTMTGVDNSPQARLTLEQQVSRDITVTYITNLNYTQEQTVRVQWDFDRNWSAVAVRDANGLFGIDIQYRRRF